MESATPFAQVPSNRPQFPSPGPTSGPNAQCCAWTRARRRTLVTVHSMRISQGVLISE